MAKKRNKKPVDAKQKHRNKRENLSAGPPRTSHFDKKSGKQISRAEKHSETATAVAYRWTEDTGGDKVAVKTRRYMKDHAKARCEYGRDSVTGDEGWYESQGNHCKINKGKFDPNYDEIFGKKDRGAATGKFKKFKKKY